MIDPQQDHREAPTPLPQHVQAQRDLMLEGLLKSLDRRRRNRRLGQALAGAAALLVLTGVALVSTRNRPAERTMARRDPPRAPAPSPEPARLVVHFLADDPNVLARFVSTSNRADHVTFVNDDQLLASLADSGFSLGIARVAGRLQFLVNDPR